MPLHPTMKTQDELKRLRAKLRRIARMDWPRASAARRIAAGVEQSEILKRIVDLTILPQRHRDSEVTGVTAH